MKKILLLLPVVLLAACATTSQQGSGDAAARTAMLVQIRAEPAGDYFVGRRYYKSDYKFWGFIRRPGQSWSTAKLVMLNENKKLAPDRAAGKALGNDNGVEYRLLGYYSGAMVYEPASDKFYPEFVLTGAELLDAHPAPIFQNLKSALDPDARIICTPY